MDGNDIFNNLKGLFPEQGIAGDEEDLDLGEVIHDILDRIERNGRLSMNVTTTPDGYFTISVFPASLCEED